MTERVILDLGEYGEILVEPVGPGAVAPEPEEGGIVKAGLGDKLRETFREIRVTAQELPKMPLTGLGALFMSALPAPLANDQWQLDEFNVEFELGLETQAGAGGPARLIICHRGAFKCVYTWKRNTGEATDALGEG